MFSSVQESMFVFVVLRGDRQVRDAKLKAVIGDVQLAISDQIVAIGAVAGYASPIGLSNGLVVVDELVVRSSNLVAGANEHGLHLRNTNHYRDYSADEEADATLVKPR